MNKVKKKQKNKEHYGKGASKEISKKTFLLFWWENKNTSSIVKQYRPIIFGVLCSDWWTTVESFQNF